MPRGAFLARILAALWLLLAAGLPGSAAAQTAADMERDRSFLAGLIEDALRGAGREVRIDGFRGALSRQASIRRLSIADGEGEWLVARDLVLDWDRAALFAGRIAVTTLAAGEIAILRAPRSEARPPSPEASAFALPDLPVAVEIGEIRADRITLGAPLLGEEIALRLVGTAKLAGGEGTARVGADRLDGAAGHFEIDFAYSNVTRVLGLAIDLSEAPGGVAARLLDLPGRPAVDLRLEGVGPIDDYAATLSLRTDGADRVTGDFALRSVAGPDGRPDREFRLDVAGDVAPLVPPAYAGFFGTEAALGLSGRYGADGALALSRLEVRTAALGLSGVASFRPDGWPESLSLVGDLRAADGAPVALPGAGGLTIGGALLVVSFDGAAGDAWSGRFAIEDLQAGGLSVPALALDGAGTIRPRAGEVPGAFTAELAYDASNLGFDDPALAAAVGPRIAGRATIARDGEGPVLLREVTVEGAGLAARLSGTIAGPSDRFLTTLAVTMAAADLGRFAALAGFDLSGTADLDLAAELRPFDGSFRLDLSGSTRDLGLGLPALDSLIGGAGRITATLARDETGTRIEGLDLATPALSGRADLMLATGDSSGSFDLTLDEVARLIAPLSGPATATGTFRLTEAAGLSVAGNAVLPGATVAGTATRAPGASAVAIDLSLSLPDLSAFAGLAGLPLAGAAEAGLRGGLSPDLGSADLALAARTSGLGIGQPIADGLIGGAGRLDARLWRTPGGAWQLDDLRLETPALALAGRAVMDGGAATVEARLALGDIGAAVPGLGGPATVGGTVRRDAAGEVTLDLSAQSGALSAALRGALDPALRGFAGEIKAAATDLSALAPLAGRPLSGAAAITATGSLAFDLGTLDLALAGRTSDIGTGIAALDPLLAGAGDLSGRIRRAGAETAWQVAGLRLATPALAAALDGSLGPEGAGSAGIALQLPDLGRVLPGLTGPAELRGDLARDAAGAVTADLEGTGAGTTLVLSAAIPSADPAATATVDLAARIGALSRLAPLAGRPLAGSAELRALGTVAAGPMTFDLRLTGRTQDLDPGAGVLTPLLAGSGTLAARLTREAPGAPVGVEGLSLAFPNLRLDGQIVAGADGSARATLDARLPDLAVIAPGFGGPATARGTADRDAAGIWRLDLAATGPGGTTADVAGLWRESGTADITAAGTAPLALLNGLLEPRRIDGLARFDLRLAGPPTLAALSGTIRSDGARISAPTFGLAVSGIGATVTLGAGRAQVAAEGRVDSGGRVAVAGPVTLAAPFPADLAVTLSDVVLRDPSLYQTTLDGRIRIAGALSGGAAITGTVALGRTELQIPSSTVGFLGELPDVRHIGADAAVATTLARAGLTPAGAERDGRGGSAGPAYPLDLMLRAPDRVFVRGRGLDAELGGELHIVGTTAEVIPSGELRLLRGRLDILQQRFALTEGSATLQGDFQPFLRLVAQTRARSGTEVSIVVEGPADDPTVRFTSTPDLPQDEVLARLLFGRDLSTITPLQAVQLAAAVGTLAGRGGGGVIAGLREGLGLDDFDISTDAEGNTALAIGKYLGENLYTDVTVTQAETAINLNFDLTPDIRATGTVTTTGETTLGIYFERDY